VKDISKDFREKAIDGLSVRNLSASNRTGHDQFFDSFALFGSVSATSESQAILLTEVSNRAARENIQLLELSVSVQSKAVQTLGSKYRLDAQSNLDEIRNQLIDSGLIKLVEKGMRDVDAVEHAYQKRMHCGESDAQPGCAVKVRYILQTSRNAQPNEVYAQLVYAFELSKVDPRVVGIGLVSPEDGQVALRDYDLQMQMIAFLNNISPNTRITLHAGELAFGSVPPEQLHHHIKDAVKLAKANRIGHGVDIGYEDNALETMQYMKDHNVAVEICLTSNDIILNVKGKNSPLRDYIKAGVPVVLGSDDQGISRIDLTNEYLRAAIEQELTYSQLKQISRNSLTWSFLPGASLWQSPMQSKRVAACQGDNALNNNVSKTCEKFLNGSEKAYLQWVLEKKLAVFESLPQWRDR
jgi:adenosine deaminase/adenosine deaminase CECR1